jgi:hypothetical protein
MPAQKPDSVFQLRDTPIAPALSNSTLPDTDFLLLRHPDGLDPGNFQSERSGLFVRDHETHGANAHRVQRRRISQHTPAE